MITVLCFVVSSESEIYVVFFCLIFQIVLHCTMDMVLAIEIRERKNCKSKWLDFTHFSTNCYFLGPRGPLRTPLVCVPSRPLSRPLSRRPQQKFTQPSHYSFSDSKLILSSPIWSCLVCTVVKLRIFSQKNDIWRLVIKM